MNNLETLRQPLPSLTGGAGGGSSLLPSLTGGAGGGSVLGGSFIVIGITDHPQPWFPPEVMEIISQGRIFSGGKRHHEIMSSLLPSDHVWIDITVPLEDVFSRYQALLETGGAGEGPTVIIFASGDPLFYGFAVTLQRRFPDVGIRVFPSFNSLQMLAHRLLLPYHDMRVVSLTGRPWHEFDRALIERSAKIGILTDREHTPSAIARRMLEYGYGQYVMHVGEHLGNPQTERVATLTLEEAATSTFAMPNCVILAPSRPPRGGEKAPSKSPRGTAPSRPPRGGASVSVGNPEDLFAPPRGGREGAESEAGWERGQSAPFGLPDSSFALLDGRAKMITKMPIRLLTLQALDLTHRHTLWDIGACTGSVSIEARLLFPHLHVVAFEIRPECEAIIRENARRHGAPGIEVRIGDFLEDPPPALPCREGADTFVAEGDDKSCLVTAPSLQGRAGGGSSPDAIFIGGHGGRLKEIMAKALQYLAPDGVIVMNSVVAPKVTTDSHRLWDEACAELGLRQEPPMRIQLNDNHPITILKAHK